MKLTKTKLFKLLIIPPLILIILSALTITAIYHFFPKDKIIAYITAEAEKITGKEVVINDLYYGLNKIALTEITVIDPEREIIILQAEEVSLGFSLKSLLGDEFEITEISVISPRIKLEFDSEGISNIQKLFPPSGKRAEQPSKRTASITKVVLRDAQIDLIRPHPYLGLTSGIYTVSAEILLDDPEKISVKNCSLKGAGTTGVFHTDLSIFPGEDWSVTASAVDVRDADLQWIYDWQDVRNVPFQTVNGKIYNLVVNSNSVSGDVKATSTLSGTPDSLNAEGECVVNINRRTVTIKNTSGVINRSTLYLNRLTLDFEGSLIDFTATEINADIRDISQVLHVMPDHIYGRVRGNLSYRGTVNADLSLRDLKYDVDSIVVSDINTDLAINENIIKKENITLRINGYPANLSLATQDKSFQKFFIRVSAEKLKIDMPEKDKKTETVTPGGFNSPVEINGSVYVKNLEQGSNRCSELNALFSIKGGTLDIRRLSTEFAGGTLNIQSTIETDSPRMTGNALINFEGLRIQKLFDNLDEFEEKAYGSLYGRSKIDFELSGNFYQSLNGTIEFNVERGKIVDTGIQHGLGIWLSELKYKLRDLEFNKIYGNLTLKGEDISINSFIFNSPNIRLNMRGGINKNLIADYLTINLEFTNDFIADLTPAVIFGLAKYREGSWYNVPFSASGDLRDPRNIRRLK